MIEQTELASWIGNLIIAGYATIGAALLAVGKLIWHLSKVDSKIDSAHAMSVRAHKRLDKLENDK